MLQEEMRNVLCYYKDRVAKITTAMDECSHELKFARGSHALLHNMFTDTNVQLQKCKQLFIPIISLDPQEPTSTFVDDSSESSDDSDLSDHDLFL